jgi:transcriptional regulator with XRE-family HTH domain
MPNTLKQFKARALAQDEVRKEYDALEEEFSFIDEILKARAESGLTQAEVAELVGTTQSAIARLESGSGKHSPSVATLQRYAQALGYRLEIRFLKNKSGRSRSSSRKLKTKARS